MSRNRLLGFVLLVLTVAARGGSAADSDPVLADPARRFVANQILIKLKTGVPGGRAVEAIGAVAGHELRAFSRIGVHQWQLGRGVSVERALEILSGPAFAKTVEYAEPNYLLYASDLPDPRFGDLYGLNNVGQTGGTPDADIDAPETWAAAAAGAPILVGVIDTGIDPTHLDLQGRIWHNQKETLNGLDDDGNGKADDVRGWDFVNNDNDPIDDNGHGTHVAGTIAAVRDNGVGVAGVASNVVLIPLKFLNAGGSGSTDNAIAAVLYADSLGAKITSNSWGGGNRSRALQDAIANSSALFVAAAGNSGSGSKEYPAGYDDAKIVSVAATDQTDALATFSNYGSSWVDIGAPGVNILSTLPNQSYGYNSGTSMATPHVSGAAAFVMSQFPNETVAQTKLRLLNGVDVVPSLQGKVSSNGRLNVARAIGVTPLSPNDSSSPGAVTSPSATPLTYHSIQLSWTPSGDDGADGIATAYDVRYVVGTGALSAANWAGATQASGEPAPLPSTGLMQSFNVDNLEQLTPYSFGLKALDEAGNASPLVLFASTSTLQAPWSVVTVAPTANTYREFDFLGTEPGVGYENGQVRYAYRTGNVWMNEAIDANGGSGVSFRFAPSGQPTLSYASGFALKLAARGAASWSVSTIESNKGTSGVTDYTSLAYAGGYAAISYRSTKSGGLKYARQSATGWRTEFVAAGGARYNALAFDQNGNPVIAFSDDLAPVDNQLDTLRVARWNGSRWSIDDVDQGPAGYGVFASIAVDGAGNIHVVHGNGNLRYAYFDGVVWTKSDIGPGTNCTLALDLNGVPYIGYNKSAQAWIATLQSDGTWQHELVDATGGGRTMVRSDGTGAPNVLYDARPDGLDWARKNP